MEEKIPLIVILGPTASGKTGLSIELSAGMDIEIISSDSRQLYKYLDIGTAKPEKHELKAVKHHFIDILEPDEYFSAGMFGEQAAIKAAEIYKSGKIPVLVGGSGLYVKALCEGFFEETGYSREEQQSARKRVEIMINGLGNDAAFDELKKVDPDSAELYSDKNPRRILRALEYYQLTGKPFSKAKQNMKEPAVNPIYFGIEWEREALYKRINMRTDLMWRGGLVDETRKVLGMGFSPELNSLNTVGYKEAIAFINGEMGTFEAVEKIKQNTRRYAKRQMTWYRRYNNIDWIDNKKEKHLHIIEKCMKCFGL